MPDLNFAVIGAELPPFAATPELVFRLHVTNTDPQEKIQSIMLRCQIRLAVTRRRYDTETRTRLLGVFGETKRWGETLRDLVWTHTQTVVPMFSGSIETEMHVPCSYDFEVISTQYYNALRDGDIPLLFLFSGTIFYTNDEDMLQATQIPWSKEARFHFPAALWHEMIAHYYPNTAWLRLNKDVFDQLYQYKVQHSLPTWEDVCLRLLKAQNEGIPL